MPRLEPERSLAARVAAYTDLEDIRLFAAEANLETPAVEGSLSYTLSSDVEYQTLGDPIRSVVVTGAYEVTVFESRLVDDEEPDDPDSSKVANVSFKLAALFNVAEPEEEAEPFEEEEYEAFAATTGRFALYPYAREFVSDVTSRMGLPALHI